MSKPNRRPCIKCQRRDTANKSRVCWECRPCPGVEVRDGLIHVEGLPPLTSEKALQLAHRLADLLTP